MTDFSQIGQTGLPRWGGFVFDEWLHELQGPRGRRVLREMSDNDAIVGAVLFSLEALIRQTEWSLKDGDDERATELVRTAMEDMDRPWSETLQEILSMFIYGWSLHEIIYKRRDGIDSRFDDGQVGWAGWPIRGQETLLRWDFSDNGDIMAMHQLGPPDYREHIIPIEKALLFRTTTRRNNPEGRSLLRTAYRSWYLKKKMEAIEGIGLERDLAGLPVASVPPELLDPNASPENKAMLDSIKKIVINLRNDEQSGVVWPLSYDDHGNKLFELQLMSTGGSRQFDTDKIISRYDQRITLTTLADFLMLGHERVGSNAMAEAKGRFFTAALRTWLGTISDIVNQQAIVRLLKMNGMDTTNPPKLQHGDIERADIDLLSQFILRVRQAGAEMDLSLDGELMTRLMEMARLPAPPDREEVDIPNPGLEAGADMGAVASATPLPAGPPGQPSVQMPKPQSPARRAPRGA